VNKIDDVVGRKGLSRISRTSGNRVLERVRDLALCGARTGGLQRAAHAILAKGLSQNEIS
jgi:hypothetical protein